jgi:hypothetical protein
MSKSQFRGVLSSSMHFWERGRLLYNSVLALIVVAFFFAGWPASKADLTFDRAFILFYLAVLANVAYCAAYVVDVFAQLSPFRNLWLRFRWLLFVVGLLIASQITSYHCSGLFHAAT